MTAEPSRCFHSNSGLQLQMPAAGNGESRHERFLCLRGIDLGIR